MRSITYVIAGEKREKSSKSSDRVREKAKEAVGRRRHCGQRNGRKKRECRRPLDPSTFLRITDGTTDAKSARGNDSFGQDDSGEGGLMRKNSRVLVSRFLGPQRDFSLGSVSTPRAIGCRRAATTE
jgi:hypothetical protein